MNRDATVVQVAILLIIVAIVGVVVLRGDKNLDAKTTGNNDIVAIQEGDAENMGGAIEGAGAEIVGSVVEVPENIVEAVPAKKLVERVNSPRTSLVKQYFAGIAEKRYDKACAVMTGGKCNVARPGSVAGFSREFEKLVNGYEYVNVIDYGIKSPSGRDIVCVKYSYRYKSEPNPGLVSEVLSFYVDEVGGELKIAERVCEKKYKEGRGLRDCPIQAAAEFCEGNIR